MHELFDSLFPKGLKGDLIKLLAGIALLVLCYSVGIKGRWLGFAVIVVIAALYGVIKRMVLNLVKKINADETEKQE